MNIGEFSLKIYTILNFNDHYNGGSSIIKATFTRLFYVKLLLYLILEKGYLLRFLIKNDKIRNVMLNEII